jgi:hypothetical protein
VGTGNIDLAGDVVKKCEVTRSKDAQELANILKNPHFKVIAYSVECSLYKGFPYHGPQNNIVKTCIKILNV